VRVLIIAAGYATRLYPLTRDFPKPLLEVGGQTILDHLMDQIREIDGIEHVHLVTNHRFVSHFDQWAAERTIRSRKAGRAHGGIRLDILDDGTTSNEDRLGAIGDMQFTIQRRGISDDLLVCAADNILQFSLKKMVRAFRANPVSTLCAREEPDVEDRKRRGVVVLDDANRVVEFQEKPEQPKSGWVALPIYIYPASVLPLIGTYMGLGRSVDAPGSFPEWLCTAEPVYAHKIDGTVLDIGNPESLAQAREMMESQR
jgi:glucose-1-phosphate thymidylyltransferase